MTIQNLQVPLEQGFIQKQKNASVVALMTSSDVWTHCNKLRFRNKSQYSQTLHPNMHKHDGTHLNMYWEVSSTKVTIGFAHSLPS